MSEDLSKRLDRLESKITQLTDAFVLSSCPMGLQKSSDRQADDELLFKVYKSFTDLGTDDPFEEYRRFYKMVEVAKEGVE
jgi:hypothetical protein